MVRDTFAGARGPIRDAVVLNAGIALAIMGADSGTDQAAFEVDLRAAMDRAEAVLDGGEATRTPADLSGINPPLASAG